MDLLQLLGENDNTSQLITLNECGRLAYCCRRLLSTFGSVGKQALVLDWLSRTQCALLTTRDPEAFLDELERVQSTVSCWGKVLFPHWQGTSVPPYFREPHWGIGPVGVHRRSAKKRGIGPLGDHFFSLCSACSHEMTNPVYWLVARARYADDELANNYLALTAYLEMWDKHHENFLRFHARICLEAAHMVASYNRQERRAPQSYKVRTKIQPLLKEDLMEARTSSKVAKEATEAIIREVVAFGLRTVAYESAEFATFFGLLDWLFQTPKLAWQDWLVIEVVSLEKRKHNPVSNNRWYEQAKRLSVAQLLCLFKFFDSESRLIKGDYPADGMERFVPELPPLSPLTSALLGSQGDLVPQQDWMRLCNFRNQIIHHSQAQRELENRTVSRRQPPLV